MDIENMKKQLKNSEYIDTELLGIILSVLNKQQPAPKLKEYSTIKEDYVYKCNDCKKRMEGIYKNYCDNCGKNKNKGDVKMIKLIYGKTGEGKTGEVIDEILRLEKGLSVVLIVEKDKEVFMDRLVKSSSLDEVLNRGYKFLNNETGVNETLKSIKEENIDVLIIDVNEPLKSFIDVLKELDIPKNIVTQQLN